MPRVPTPAKTDLEDLLLRVGRLADEQPDTAGEDGFARSRHGGIHDPESLLQAALMLPRSVSADAAAFAASEWARTMTAATVNVSCGALVD